MQATDQSDNEVGGQDQQQCCSEPGQENLFYESDIVWSIDRPDTLVVCCSDGRLQMSIDDFLLKHLNINHYDRLYAPGGAGALSNVGDHHRQTFQYRKDFKFLLEAHKFTQVILMFHGAAADGPAHSTCAHYSSIMPNATRDDVIARQQEDMNDVETFLHGLRANLEITAFRADVTGELHLRFVKL